VRPWLEHTLRHLTRESIEDFEAEPLRRARMPWDSAAE